MKILDRNQCAKAYCKAINDAEEFLIICSPYFDIHEHFNLRGIDAKKVKILYRRKKNGYPDFKTEYFYKLEEEVDYLKNNKKIDIQFLGIPDLHTKCMINEKFAVMTSMNMTDYSSSNNYEMGIQVWSNKNVNEFDKKKNAEDIRRYNEICLCVASIYSKKAQEAWNIYNEVCNDRRDFKEFYFENNPIENFLFSPFYDFKYDEDRYSSLVSYLGEILQLHPTINENSEYIKILLDKLNLMNEKNKSEFEKHVENIIVDVTDKIIQTEKSISKDAIKNFLTTSQELIIDYYESNYIKEKDFVIKQIEEIIKTKRLLNL